MPWGLIERRGRQYRWGTRLLGSWKGRGTQQHAGEVEQVDRWSPRLQGGYRGRDGAKGIEETEDVTWGSQASPQVYYKYGPPADKSGSSVRPP